MSTLTFFLMSLGYMILFEIVSNMFFIKTKNNPKLSMYLIIPVFALSLLLNLSLVTLLFQDGYLYTEVSDKLRYILFGISFVTQCLIYTIGMFMSYNYKRK